MSLVIVQKEESEMLEFRYDTQLLIEGTDLDEDMITDYITEHFYNCTDEILSGLGKMYAADGEFRENIDAAAGKGTAVFASAAIAAYCG